MIYKTTQKLHGIQYIVYGFWRSTASNMRKIAHKVQHIVCCICLATTYSVLTPPPPKDRGTFNRRGCIYHLSTDVVVLTRRWCFPVKFFHFGHILGKGESEKW